MQNVTLNVQGMSCNHCVHTISGVLGKLGATAIVDLSAGTVAVEYDESKYSLELIIATIEELGYIVLL